MKDEMMQEVEIDEIGDTKMGEAKGTMNFPQERKRVAKKIVAQQRFKGLPKQWKGRGDYFFEAQDDGSLKITGGDAAKSLTGGKSTVITDDDKIKEILQKARGGDIIEENVSYQMKSKGAMSAEDLATIPTRREFDTSDGGIRDISASDAEAGMEERLQESGPDVRKADMSRGVDLLSERESKASADDPLLQNFKQTRTLLQGMVERAENEQQKAAYTNALKEVEQNFRKTLQQRGIALNQK